jgi:hypothetical protein
MKKITLLLAMFCLVAINGLYAQKCDFDKDELDAYSKQKYRMVKHVFGSMVKKWVFIMEQKGDKYYVTLNMAENGDFIRNVAKAGTDLLMKMDNGTVVTATVETDAVPSVQLVNGNTAINSQWMIKCVVTPEKLKLLSEALITGMRINMGDRDFDSPELKSKQGERIKQSAACLLQQ